ncbi:hypothetical protein ACFWBI_13480 [Streptomyces sp. NPDC059982]|uniref:hypothetical protein n=1 Tax=unclassified Streptomyces TaxID=2593676 RepID=UPI0036CD822E
MTDKPSLRAYLKRYAAGGIPREEMLDTVAAWDFDDEVRDDLVIEPTRQDNTHSVVSGAALRGLITREDLVEIQQRIDARD